MSQAGAQVASDQFSSPEVLNGSKPSKKRLSLSSNGRKGSKPINSRAPFVGAKPAPLLFVITLPPLLTIWWLCSSIAKFGLSKRCAVDVRLELQGDTEIGQSALWIFTRTGGRLYAMFAAFSHYFASALASSNKPGSSAFLLATTSSSDVAAISPLIKPTNTPCSPRARHSVAAAPNFVASRRSKTPGAPPR